jgi:hypothetical protein
MVAWLVAPKALNWVVRTAASMAEMWAVKKAESRAVKTVALMALTWAAWTAGSTAEHWVR